jgi:hypothetical protein
MEASVCSMVFEMGLDTIGGEVSIALQADSPHGMQGMI